MAAKKKFFETTVGKVLKGVGSVLAPKLVDVLDGATSVEEALTIVKESGESDEIKLKFQQLILDQYELEVSDRIAARQREAMVAASGGSDLLFKTIGWSIAASFLVVVSAAVGLWEVPEDQQRLFDMGFGAVVAQMTAIVSYYFGSSFGSKQKTEIIKSNGKS